MAKLTTKARKALPGKSFAGPGRSFPIEDKDHARKAIQLAPRAEKAGSITPMQKAMIDKKARAKLGK
jgi:hypothetical protein